MTKTMLKQQANEQLQKVQSLLAKVYPHKQIPLHIENIKTELEAMRILLVEHKRRLEQEKQTQDVIDCQNAIYAALLFFAKHYPLNQQVGEDLICPLSGKIFTKHSGITLSNGCQYHKNIIGYVAEKQKFYPRFLPGSSLPLDKQDIQKAQRVLKGDMVVFGMRAGSLGGILLWMATLGIQIGLGISFSSLIYAGLMGLGIGTIAATCLTGGAILLPFMACLAIGGVLGAVYFAKKYPHEFAPPKTKENVNTSTAVAFEKLEADTDYHLDRQPQPEVKAESQPLLPEARTEYVFDPVLLKR